MPRAKSKSKSMSKNFRCAKCDRTFAMAAHLARHQNTMHARGLNAKSAKRSPIGQAVRQIGARHAADTDVQLVGQMREYRDGLLAQRAGLDDRIDAIDRAMATLGAPSGPAPKRGGTRVVRGGRKGGASLKMCVENVLRRTGKPMSVKDITSGVVKVGYKTSNKTLDKSVGIALAAMPNVARVSRGIFRLK